MVPGRDGLFLVNIDGWSFSEISASRPLICDFDRNVVAGDDVPEDTVPAPPSMRPSRTPPR